MAAFQVFVSHASTDAAIVRRLRESLEPHGVDLWIDRRELAPGDALESEIRTAIDESAHVIVVLSPEALKSAWVKKEVGYAREVRSRRAGFRLVPVLRPPFEPSMTSWILGEDVVAIPLGEEPGAFDHAVAEILVALGYQLREDTSAGNAQPQLQTLDDLTLELREPEFCEEGAIRRAAARARLVYRPADPGVRPVESEPFRFVAPLGPIEAEDLAWYLQRYSTWPSEHFQVRARRVEASLPEWGQKLYEALAPAKALSVLEAWRRSAAGSRRFSVLVNEASLEGDGAAAKVGATLLLSLPWELVHDGRDYLFQGARGVRVRRQLPNREPMQPLEVSAPIRVLLVSPRPEDENAAYTDHRVSARPLVEALGPLGELVELSLLRPPTFKALDAELRRADRAGKPYHVVHFDGHGVYDKKLGLGALCFENPDDAGKLTERRTDVVQADKIAAVMRDHRIPLVFLEACQTAMSDVDPTASVAGRLLERGVASVVAMSHSVLVETARRFVGAFYRSLMAGERVGEAMLEGQRELANDTRRGRGFAGDFHLQDWFVPVLYQETLDPSLMTSVPGERVRRVVAHGRKLLLGKLPEVPAHGFVGRSRELLAVERLLERESYAVVLGEGGEGKTTLAAELARWLVATRRFARAAFVSLEHALDVRAVVSWLGGQLVPGFVVEASREPEKAVPLLERALCERPTIVVLDNLESLLPPPEGSQLGLERVFEPELLADLLGLCERLRDAGETRLVFTSREALPVPFARRGNTVRITRLDRADAVKLVSDVLGEENVRPLGSDAGESEEEIERLVDAVGCHASCLVLVAREVAAVGVRGAADRLEVLMAAMAERYGNDRERSLFASVELSLQRLPDATRRRLPRLGVFQGGANVVAIALVLGLGDDPQVAVDIAQQLVDVGLGELLSYGHLRLHPALGPLLRTEIGEAELEEARRAWVGAMMALAEYLYQQRFQDAGLAATLTVLELPNLIGALELLREIGRAEEAVKVAAFIEGLLQFLGRPLAMGRVVGIRKKAAEGLREWGQAAFEARRSEIDRLLEGGCFAEALEASRLLLQLGLAAGESAYEGAAYDLAGAYFMLGRGLWMSGAAEAALKPLSEARERFERLGGQKGVWMANTSLGEIGDCWRDLGRLDEAAAAYEVTIQVAERLNDRRSSAVHRAQLGTVRMLQRRYADALDAHTQARKTFEQLGELGSVAVAWHNSGMVCQDALQYEEAEQAYQEALKIRMQLGDRPGEADSLRHLGQLHGLKGRSEDAVCFFLQEVEIRSGFGDRMREGHSRNHLAVELIKLQRYDEARQEIQRAIECLKLYGHAAQLWKTFANLHDLERSAGNAPAAERAREDAIEVFLSYRRAGGENHEPRAQLVAAVGQAVASGDLANITSELAELAARPDLPEPGRVLIPVLQQIFEGSRDPALVSTAGLQYDDAVEVILLLERLG